MAWNMISLTITTYLNTTHPTYNCFLSFSDSHGFHRFNTLEINDANKLMWELKLKGWETKITARYNPYSARIFTREIRWLHIDDGTRED